MTQLDEALEEVFNLLGREITDEAEADSMQMTADLYRYIMKNRTSFTDNVNPIADAVTFMQVTVWVTANTLRDALGKEAAQTTLKQTRVRMLGNLILQNEGFADIEKWLWSDGEVTE